MTIEDTRLSLDGSPRPPEDTSIQELRSKIDVEAGARGKNLTAEVSEYARADAAGALQQKAARVATSLNKATHRELGGREKLCPCQSDG